MRRNGRWAGAVAIGAVLALAAPALAAPAELDTDFGVDGIARVALHDEGGITFDVTDVAVDGAGRTVLLGGFLAGDPLGGLTGFDLDLAVARLLPDGSPDPDFGTDGVARFDVGGLDIPGRLALDGSGRAVASATRIGEDGSSAGAVVRLTPDGSLDTTFAGDGIAQAPAAAVAFVGEVVVDAAGRPSVALITGDGDEADDASAVVLRFTAAGAPDAGFGDAGRATVVASRAGALGLALDGDGLLVGGVTEPDGAFVARVTGAGALDPSFGSGGTTSIDLPASVGWAVERTADGGALVAGTVGQRSGFVARVDGGGTLDDGFGVGGVRTVRGADAGPFPLRDLVVDAAGTISLAGVSAATSGGAVGRILASGRADSGFGGDGFVRPLESTETELAAVSAVGLGPDGRLSIGGVIGSTDTIDGFAARFRAVAPGAPVTGTEVRRLAGTDRVATSIELSRTAFAAAATPGGRRAGEVVLAAADRFPDALVAAPYAAAFEAPVLLNPADRLDPRVRAEIDRVLGGEGPVTLMGGVNAIGLPVEAELRAAGYTVSRIAGQDRYDTSVQVAQLLPAEVVVLARGDDFPDALAAGPAAAELGGPVLLTAGRQMPDSVRAHLDGQPDVVAYAVGGQAAAAAPDAVPVAGTDRYDTAARVAARFFRTPPRTVVASGERFPDALAGGALAALTGSPLLLATRTSLPAPSAAALERVGPYHRIVALAGGTAVLDDAVRSATQRAAAG